jgi:hypothetical protein
MPYAKAQLQNLDRWLKPNSRIMAQARRRKRNVPRGDVWPAQRLRAIHTGMETNPKADQSYRSASVQRRRQESAGRKIETPTSYRTRMPGSQPLNHKRW